MRHPRPMGLEHKVGHAQVVTQAVQGLGAFFFSPQNKSCVEVFIRLRAKAFGVIVQALAQSPLQVGFVACRTPLTGHIAGLGAREQ